MVRDGAAYNPGQGSYFDITRTPCTLDRDFLIDSLRNIDRTVEFTEQIQLPDSSKVNDGGRVAYNDHLESE